MGPRRESESASAPRKRRQPQKDTNEYLQKRERNNVAVKKSREKARTKQQETNDLVGKLRNENKTLETKVSILSKELDLLRGIFADRISPRDYGNSVPEQCLSEEDVRIKEEESDDDNGNNSDMSAGAGVLMDHEYCS